ncbi:MAG: CCA tRNA nucleotidyltransferase [Candidatus Omnitrophica bacterium]|nr:CCA tRNA nucleotidyltransferase [Candidatus Omnitrophota bacterium]
MKSCLKFSPEDRKLLKDIYNFSRKKRLKLYLVGGVLRDFILGRVKENPDFDFAVKRNALTFGRALAKRLRCGFVVLDKEHGSCRLVKAYGAKFYTFDFTDFRGKDLETDLKHRDFTINAIALKLEDGLTNKDFSGTLIDLYGGKEDIRSKIIRVANNRAFLEDPLRILRAFSFSSSLEFTIDKNTLKLARLYKNKLSVVSAERIREELFKIFATGKSYGCLVSLDKIKALDIIFPEIKKMRKIGQGPYHHLDVWQHTLETVKQLELIFKELKDKDILGYLGTLISSDRRRKALLKFAAFLHDFGKPKTLRRQKGRTTFHGHERVGLKIAEDIAKRIKLSNDEIYSLRKIVLWHLRPGYLADSENPTARAKFRYFRDTGCEALSTLLLSLADQRSTKGPFTTFKARKQHERVVAGLIREYLEKDKEEKPVRLLNGNEIMREFKLTPSPLVGRILSLIEELQAIGKVKNKEEAFKAAAKLIKQR